MHSIKSGVHCDRINFFGHDARSLMTDELDEKILKTAEALFIRYGYDKTTLLDVAREADISRSTLYARWSRKETLFMALVWHSSRRYVADWIARVEADPEGGGFGSLYRHALLALEEDAFVKALMGQNRRILGSVLQRPEMRSVIRNRLEMGGQMLRQFQACGVIRPDVDLEALAYLIQSLQYGMLHIDAVLPAESSPSWDRVSLVMVEVLERSLTPANGGNRDAGKEIVRAMLGQMLALIDQAQSVSQADAAERPQKKGKDA